jgi:hypothetical protein
MLFPAGCGGAKTATREDPGPEKKAVSCESSCAQQQDQCLRDHGVTPGEGEAAVKQPDEVSKAEWEATFKRQKAQKECEEAHRKCLDTCKPGS